MDSDKFMEIESIIKILFSMTICDWINEIIDFSGLWCLATHALLIGMSVYTHTHTSTGLLIDDQLQFVKFE